MKLPLWEPEVQLKVINFVLEREIMTRGDKIKKLRENIIILHRDALKIKMQQIMKILNILIIGNGVF